MDDLPGLGLVLLGALGAVVLTLGIRRLGPDQSMVQQQLVELRQGLERLTAGQRSVPEALAEGRAQQAASMNRQFTDLARSLNAQLSSSEQAVGERLADAGAIVSDLRERLGHLAAATERLEDIGSSVAHVQDLLRVPRLRGALGEMWLEELLSQVFPADLYEIQYGFPTGERVDAVLRLGGRLVPIDAKFPLHESERLASSEGNGDRARRAFIRSVRDRVDEIATKYIRPGDGTYDFALMYVPAETVYYEIVAAAHTDTRPLLAYALDRRVIPVSPNTFYAYLTVILHGLRGLQVEGRTREILAGLEQVSAQLERAQRQHDIIGKHLEHAIRQHGESSQVLNGARAGIARMVDPAPLASPDGDQQYGADDDGGGQGDAQ